MKTPDELLKELQGILFKVEEADLTVKDYGGLLSALAELPEIPASAMPGLDRLADEILRSCEAIIDSHNRMREIVKRLANP